MLFLLPLSPPNGRGDLKERLGEISATSSHKKPHLTSFPHFFTNFVRSKHNNVAHEQWKK